MSYVLGATAVTNMMVPTAGNTSVGNAYILRVRSLAGNKLALERMLKTLSTERASVAASFAKSPTSSTLKAKLAQIDEAIALCRNLIRGAATTSTSTRVGLPLPGASTVAVESETIAVNPNGTITPGPGASVVTTPEVAPSSGAEAADVTVSSGSIGTVALVGGGLFLLYLMLKKRGAA